VLSVLRLGIVITPLVSSNSYCKVYDFVMIGNQKYKNSYTTAGFSLILYKNVLGITKLMQPKLYIKKW
jgi:hypothetical protein